MSKNKLITFMGILTLIIAVLIVYIVFANKKSEKISFENKIECVQYRSDILKELDEWNVTKRNYFGNGSNTVWMLDNLFYSPIENSCLQIVSVFSIEKGRSDIQIWDVLTKNIIKIYSLKNDYSTTEELLNSQREYEKFLSDRSVLK